MSGQSKKSGQMYNSWSMGYTTQKGLAYLTNLKKSVLKHQTIFKLQNCILEHSSSMTIGKIKKKKQTQYPTT